MKQLKNIFTGTFILLLFTGPVHLTSVQAADTDTMLQCMADCIIEEGASAKETCKQQCSGINIDMKQYQQKDCMAIFKQCKKDCEGDKDCSKTCKTNLLNCS